ncbi:multicopper oxidase family protein [Streptomyces sp. NPDC091217]|uniref:multicopper oxidase family protein n=1 Tax=Streptomyces sp. NPDC091217 TaxID=3365975 RepID=UPI003806F7C7
MHSRFARRWSGAGSSLAALVLASGCGGSAQDDVHVHASPASSRSAAVSPSPALTGPATAALRDPEQLVSENGLLKTRVVVERKKVELAGRRLWALTYNGRFMPPTLRINPGDRMEIAFENRLDKQTNLHVHGMHVSPSGSSDNIFLSIAPGQTYHYAYQFPKSLEPGTYWYHPHAHTLSAAQTGGGMSGIIVVDGLDRYLPPELRHITEHVIALKDFQIVRDEIKTQNLKMGAPTTRTVNGQLNPLITIRPGETQLWRLANISSNIFYEVALKGQKFHVVAQDGYPVNTVYSADSIVIPAGARYDVLVQGGPRGTRLLETLPYNTGKAGNQFPRATLATVRSAGEPMTARPLPTAFAPADDLGRAHVAARKTIVYTENKAGTKFYVNGRQFDHRRVDFRVKLNTVEEWTIRNNTDEVHSFHVHTNDFQVMSINGKPQRNYGFQDTVDIPQRGNMVIRTRFLDYPGRTVLHCHVLNHEDLGMMSVLQIDR